jgi:hypothetical protein
VDMVFGDMSKWGGSGIAALEDLRRESNHLALSDVLLNTRLERGIAIVDWDFFAIRSSACGVLCMRSHCRMVCAVICRMDL